MKDKRLTSVPKLPSRSITRISDPISLRRLQVPCAQFEPLIHDKMRGTWSPASGATCCPAPAFALEIRYVASEGRTCRGFSRSRP